MASRAGLPASWFHAGSGTGSAEALFACCHASEFPAQALLRVRPQLQGPVAVLEGNPPHERVCAGNAAARRSGLLNGMSRVEAESFAAITLLRRSEREEAGARAVMLAAAGRVSPYVEPHHTDLAAMCVLDISGMARLYREPHTLARALKAALQAHGIHVSVAISCNFHTACLLVQGKPGITIVAPGEEAAALAPLLLACLRLEMPDFGEEQLQTLALWGIRTLGALAALPEKQLIARLGLAARQVRELARGKHPHLFAPTSVTRELREEFTFEALMRRAKPLLFVLSSMLEELLLQARKQALALAALTVTWLLDARAVDSEDDGRSDHNPDPHGSLIPGGSRSMGTVGVIHLVPQSAPCREKPVLPERTGLTVAACATEPEASPLKQISTEERPVAGYSGTGLTTGHHPLYLQRQHLERAGVLTARQLSCTRDGVYVQTAGCVIARQRPGTASGFIFLSLEDETGISNVVIRAELYERERVLITSGKLLHVEGRLQNGNGVTHVRADRVQLLSVGGAPVQSHDFH